MADGLEFFFVLILDRLYPGECLAAPFHGEFRKCVAGPRGRRRAEHFDRGGGQCRVDLLPGLVGIRDQGFAAIGIWHSLGERQPQILWGEVIDRRFDRVRHHDAVVTDRHFHHLADTVLAAIVQFPLLHAPRGIDHVRVLHADPGAEQLDATAGSGGLHLGRVETATLAKTFRNHGRKRVYGG